MHEGDCISHEVWYQEILRQSQRQQTMVGLKTDEHGTRRSYLVFQIVDIDFVIGIPILTLFPAWLHEFILGLFQDSLARRKR